MIPTRSDSHPSNDRTFGPERTYGYVQPVIFDAVRRDAQADGMAQAAERAEADAEFAADAHLEAAYEDMVSGGGEDF